MMTDDQLNAIEARADAAPKGQYWASTKADGPSLNNGNVLRLDESGDLCVILQANHYFQSTFPLLDFVAEARTDIPALVAEVRRLRRQVYALCDVIYDANGIAYPFENMQDKMTAIINGAESEGE